MTTVRNQISLIEAPATYPERFPVAPECVDWHVSYPDYNPTYHDRPRALTEASKEGDYADPTNPNDIDWLQRHSLTGSIQFDSQGYPLNPGGRTGLRGRGILNAWGPTLAADAIVTRPGTHSGTKEMLAIVRGDNNNLSTVGGKLNVNPHNVPIETPLEAAIREHVEETTIWVDLSDAVILHKGNVDDERNTDNAWLETVIFYKHFYDRRDTETMIPRADGTEVKKVLWLPVVASLETRLNAGLGKIILPRLLASA